MASHPTPACCGTSKAAELLQLSVGTVQSLVDKNILNAWVTEGGHRRISLESIHNYQVQQQKLPALERLINDRLRVMVVDDDVTRHMLQDTCLAVHAQIDCSAWASAIEALLQLPLFKPHILFLDLLMPQVDGWEMVRQVKLKEDYSNVQIFTYSALSPDELQERGGPPKGASFLSKPLDLGWLKGYLLGMMSPQTRV